MLLLLAMCENTQCTLEKSGFFQASQGYTMTKLLKKTKLLFALYTILYSESEFFKVNVIDQWIQINHYWPSIYNLLSSRNAEINNNSQRANYKVIH